MKAIEKPVFSIIMPCYNSEKYVERAIQSIVNQEFKNWQLIIVNDGSEDNTLNIVEAFSREDRRICIYSKANGGYVSAVNYGLEYVEGIYFMFLGSDDEISPTLFSDVYTQIERRGFPELIGFKTLMKTYTGKQYRDKNTDFDRAVEDKESDIRTFSEKYSKETKIFFTRDTAKMFKTEVLGELRYYGKKGIDADGIFSMLFAHKATSFLCVPVVGYIWHLRKDSVSSRKKDYETQIDRINNWVTFGEKVLKLDPSKITRQEQYFLIGYFYDIIRDTYYDFRKQCIKEGVIDNAKATLIKHSTFLGNEMLSKEQKMFLQKNQVWKIYVILKIIYEKIVRKIRVVVKRVGKRIARLHIF